MQQNQIGFIYLVLSQKCFAPNKSKASYAVDF